MKQFNLVVVFLLISPLIWLDSVRGNSSEATDPKHEKVAVKVFHYILNHWGKQQTADFSCHARVNCEWVSATELTELGHMAQAAMDAHSSSQIPLVSVSMYNIHSLWETHQSSEPQICQLSTNLSMFETEESKIRFSWLTDGAQKYFDGYSSPHPDSSVQRIYDEAYLDESTLFPLKDFSSLVKAGAFIASDCHEWANDHANGHRNTIVTDLRTDGFRIDGLGKCLHTDNIPESGKTLDLTNFYGTHPRGSHFAKIEALNNYAFTMAFENSIESGYVTEKPFDALVAGKNIKHLIILSSLFRFVIFFRLLGSVPVFLGDSAHLKSLLPDPMAAIFLSDFKDLKAVAQYLNHLLVNETAYEQHRRWRHGYSLAEHKKGKALMEKSWECRVCDWAAKQYYLSKLAKGCTLAPDPCLAPGTRASTVEEKRRRNMKSGRP
jgi:hypothetical protein